MLFRFSFFFATFLFLSATLTLLTSTITPARRELLNITTLKGTKQEGAPLANALLLLNTKKGKSMYTKNGTTRKKTGILKGPINTRLKQFPTEF